MKKTILPLMLVAAITFPTAVKAQTSLYWGGGDTTPANSVDVTGTAIANLTGTWDSVTTNWNASSSATTGWQAWDNSAIAIFKSSQGSGGPSSPIRLNEDLSAAGITAIYPAGSSNQHFTLTGSPGSVDRTITLGANSVITVSSPGVNNSLVFERATGGFGAAILAGINGFTFTGVNVAGAPAIGSWLDINSAATISGDVIIKTGEMRIGTGDGNASGSMVNVEKFTVGGNNARISFQAGSATNLLSDTATVILQNGIFAPGSRGNATSFNETIGGITLEGSGAIVADPRFNFGATASTQSTLSLANGFNRGDNGKGVLDIFTSNDSAVDGGLGAATGLKITGHGIPANTAFIPWAMSTGYYTTTDGGVITNKNAARFLATDSNGVLLANNATAGSFDLASWAGAGYSNTTDLAFDIVGNGVTPFTNTLTGNVEVRSLAVGGTNSATATISLAGNTLKANAIGMGSLQANTNMNLGTNDANRGVVTANGNSGGELYLIHHRQNSAVSSTFTVNSELADNGGQVDVIFGGAFGQFSVTGTTSYSGKTYINAGSVTLSSASASLENSSEINIASGSLLSTTSFNRTFGGAVVQTIAGGGGSMGGANISAGTRTITIGALGTLAPGDAGANENFVFSLSTGKLSFLSGATVALDLDTPANSDKISFAGTAGDFLSGPGNFKLDLTTGAGFEANAPYTVFSNVTTVGFNPGSVYLDNVLLTNVTDYTWSQVGNDYTITLLIPEPSAFLMVSGGVAMLSLFRRRRRCI